MITEHLKSIVEMEKKITQPSVQSEWRLKWIFLYGTTDSSNAIHEATRTKPETQILPGNETTAGTTRQTLDTRAGDRRGRAPQEPDRDQRDDQGFPIAAPETGQHAAADGKGREDGPGKVAQEQDGEADTARDAAGVGPGRVRRTDRAANPAASARRGRRRQVG